MDDTPKTPNFAAWNLETLAKFAADAHKHMQEQDVAIFQLRADLKDAMAQLRQHLNKDDWK